MSGWDGRPENPERDGWHWVGSPISGEAVAVWWSGTQRAQSPYWTMPGGSYLGPCLTPADHAAAVQRAVEAEREAIIAAMDEPIRLVFSGDRVSLIGKTKAIIADRIRARAATPEAGGREKG